MIDDPEDNRSLARERTVLAWQRTGLAYLGTALLLLRALPDDMLSHRTLFGSGLILTGAAAVVFGFVQRRMTGPPAFRIISLAMTLLAAAALVASVVPD